MSTPKKSAHSLRIVTGDQPNDAGTPTAFARIERELIALLTSNDEAGAVDALDLAMQSAVDSRATDLYFEPWDDCTALRFRIDGLLHEVARLPRDQHPRIAARVKILARMVTYQRDMPQDGRIDPDATPVRRAVRISTFPTVNGERVVLRIMDGADSLLDLGALGFSSDIETQLRALATAPQGTILLTGPSSSGKTTTIYAVLRELLAHRVPAPHVVTIEDPVERRLPGVAQTETAPHQGLTFESALRSLLRQDPEVIMVGEIRDPETARTAVQAGLTGHLVISSIHSANAPAVFTRLLDMGVEPYLAASSITGVLAQRLVRTICPACATEYAPDPVLVTGYGLQEFDGPYLRGTGCAACQGIGYRGRTAIGELLLVNEAISELVLTRPRTAALHTAARDAGMHSLHEAGAQRVRDGKTTLEELRRILPPGSQP